MYIREITFSFTSSAAAGVDYFYSEFIEDPDKTIEQIILETEDDCLIIKADEGQAITYAKTIVKAIIEEYCKNAEIPFRLETEDEDSVKYSFEYEEDSNDEESEEEQEQNCINLILRDEDGVTVEGWYSLGDIVKLIKRYNIQTIVAL